MNQTVVFTADVLRALNGLPEEERITVTNALVSNFLLGRDITSTLSGISATVYALLNCSIDRASRRYNKSCQE